MLLTGVPGAFVTDRATAVQIMVKDSRRHIPTGSEELRGLGRQVAGIGDKPPSTFADDDRLAPQVTGVRSRRP